MRFAALIAALVLTAGQAVAAPSATSDLNVGSAADVDAVLSGEPNVECDTYGTDSRGGAITGNCRDAGPRIGELSSETELSIPDLMQQHSGTDAFTCIRYRAAGACFWLKCTAFPPRCRVRTSVLVTHYNPDALVEVNQSQEYPLAWATNQIHDVATSLGSTIQEAVGGTKTGQGRQTGGNRRAVSNLQFHDALAIGNPVLPAFTTAFSSITQATDVLSFCESRVTPMYPYYSSEFDPEWRWGLLERLSPFLGLSNFRRSISTGIDVTNTTASGDFWGHIYPRMGYVRHHDTYRSSAVVAQRVADLLTTRDVTMPHIVNQLPTGVANNAKAWGPGHAKEDDNSGGYWQMNFPAGKQEQCKTFPIGNSAHVDSPANNYLWTLWRKYKCCAKKGQTFLYKVEIGG